MWATQTQTCRVHNTKGRLYFPCGKVWNVKRVIKHHTYCNCFVEESARGGKVASGEMIIEGLYSFPFGRAVSIRRRLYSHRLPPPILSKWIVKWDSSAPLAFALLGWPGWLLKVELSEPGGRSGAANASACMQPKGARSLSTARDFLCIHTNAIMMRVVQGPWRKCVSWSISCQVFKQIQLVREGVTPGCQFTGHSEQNSCFLNINF